MKFEQFVDKLFWGTITILAGIITTQAHSINENIQKLNENVAVIMEKVANQDRRLDALESWKNAQGDSQQNQGSRRPTGR